jgi:hypothetical protein
MAAYNALARRKTYANARSIDREQAPLNAHRDARIKYIFNPKLSRSARMRLLVRPCAVMVCRPRGRLIVQILESALL